MPALVHPTTAILTAFAADPARPRITAYAERTGARVELAGPTLGNWAAKYANFFLDSGLVTPGATLTLTADVGWQLPGLLLGAWWAGLRVSRGEPGPQTALIITLPEQLAEIDALGHPAEIAVASTDSFGRSLASCGVDVPLGVWDLSGEVQVCADEFTRPQSPPATLIDSLTAAELLRPISPQRRLVAGSTLDPDWPVDVVPTLAAGGSVVLVQPAVDTTPERLAHLAAVERCSA